MESLLELICGAEGVSGSEEPIAGIVEDIVSDYVDKIERDALGNVIFTKDGTREGPTIVMCAHMDEIGAMVRYIDEKGFIYFDVIGGHNAMQLLGSSVNVGYCTRGIIECKDLSSKEVPTLKDLYVDIGASSRDDAAACGIHIGSIISRVPCYQRLQGTKRVSKAFDNRAGLYCLVTAFRALEEFGGKLIGVATTQEEVGTRGAAVIGTSFNADIAIAIDVTFAFDTPQARDKKDENTALGKGPAITLKDDGQIMRSSMRSYIESICASRKIPLQYDISKGKTDAAPLYTSSGNVNTASVVVPLRYMHSGHEIIDLKDLEETVKLLTAIVEDIESYEF